MLQFSKSLGNNLDASPHSMLTSNLAYFVGIFALSRLQQTFLHHLVQESAGQVPNGGGGGGGGGGGVGGGAGGNKASMMSHKADMQTCIP